MSSFGQNIIVLGGKFSHGICGMENSVFVIDTSFFLFPSEAIPATRNASLRKVLSDVPLQGVGLPSPFEPKSQVWSAIPSTPAQTSFQSNPTQFSTPASPVSVTSQSSSPVFPVPISQTTNDPSGNSPWLIESLEEESFPPSLGYTPPHSVENWDLLRFLRDECKALSRSFKIKSLSEPAVDRESHFSRGENDGIEYQRDIDRGTNSDVFQVSKI